MNTWSKPIAGASGRGLGAYAGALAANVPERLR